MNTAHNEVAAARKTFDGVSVIFYANGEVAVSTDRLHERVVARGLSRELRTIVADDVCAYDASELRGLIKAARRAEQARRDVWARSVAAANATDLRQIMRAHAPR